MQGMPQTAFCINCGCKNKYRRVTEKAETEVRGVQFSYAETRAICEKCGEELYVPEINDSNARSREDAYRKAAKLITVDEIQNILKKYNIGASPLAQVLGFGDVTITRYLSGQLPSRQNSDKLLEVSASHKLMAKYLEKNRDKITEHAYANCAEALQKLDVLYSSRKIEVVIRYFLKQISEVTPLALQKMLYYAQAFYYSFYKNELFSDPCQAWAHGPVYPDVYQKYKMYGYNPIDAPELEQEDTSELTLREVELLDSIIESFGCYSGTVLEKMTHNERPWQNARGSLLPKDRSETEINREDVHLYFSEVVEKYAILNPCDICNYSEAMIRKVMFSKS